MTKVSLNLTLLGLLPLSLCMRERGRMTSKGRAVIVVRINLGMAIRLGFCVSGLGKGEGNMLRLVERLARGTGLK